MDLNLIPVDQFQVFLVVLARVAGFIGAIPVFSSAQSPTKIKITMIFAFALLLYPAMSKGLPAVSFAPLAFTLFLVAEVLLGAIIGLVARLIFTAVEYGATVIGFQMGFAAANVFDPTSERQIALISQFQNVFAILTFLAVDGHHLFFRLAIRSFDLLPPGHLNLSGDAVPFLMDLGAKMFALGVQFSAPVLAILLLSGLVLGILARIFPQLNVFLLSFPINIATAFIVIALTLDLASALLRREFDLLGETLINMMGYLNF
ncbi:flagellar biosynthetic protein FliR [Desulfosediminicola flagellatus]|uniref:flagellar biosynthetic protein FliR n=1 Tax=Desulfosediminicola flagellatus TaxID=2569541 RepID=UPI0010AB6F1F|nr:flagellar biosynthetic protein FliR [Desulfosediminicola flagellatus]